MHGKKQYKSWFDLRTEKGEGSSNNTKQFFGCYTDLTGKKWYGKLRPFLNKPISIYYDLHVADHVILGEAQSNKPEGVRIWGETLQWPKLYSKRCDYEVLCRWHDLTVP